MSSARSPITTHVLDTATGRPAARVPIALFIAETSESWRLLGKGVTDNDGRIVDLLPADHQLARGSYRMRFETGTYFKRENISGFYPYADVVFQIRDARTHYHIPLLLSPFGYSTYRGS
jgi:5-hydroxyisourate hydrolase